MKKISFLLFVVVLTSGCFHRPANDEAGKMIEVNGTNDQDQTISEEFKNDISDQLGIPFEELSAEDFKHIKKIAINYNDPTLEDVFKKLTNLQNLSVNVPIDYHMMIEDFIQLKYLDIMNNSFTDVAFLSPLTELKELYLHRNDIENIDGLATLHHLKILSITNNKIQDVTPLEKLVSLEYLEIHDNAVHSLTPIASLENLTMFIASNNVIEDATALTNLHKLTFVNLSDNPLEAIDFAKGLSDLDRLQISDTNVADLTPLANAKNLYYLDIRGTKVTSIQPLVGLTKLKYVLLNKETVKDWALLEKDGGPIISEMTIMAE